MASTYKVYTPWQRSGSRSGYLSGDGKRYHRRRTVLTYKYGNPNFINKYTEYKDETKTSKTDVIRDVESRKLGTKLTSAEAYKTIEAKNEAERLKRISAEYAIKAGTTGRNDPDLLRNMTSAEQRLYDTYTAYLAEVDERNNALKADIQELWKRRFYRQLVNKRADNRTMLLATRKNVEREFNRRKEDKMSFQAWQRAGGKPLTKDFEYDTIDELASLQKLDKDVQRIIAGMEKGWQIANDLYLPQLAVLSALSQSNLFSTTYKDQYGNWKKKRDPEYYDARNLIRNVAREVSQTVAPTTRTIIQSRSPETIHYKKEYRRLNAIAKKRGVIKGDWTLRIPRSVPIKERWRRLYHTLKNRLTKRGIKTN